MFSIPDFDFFHLPIFNYFMTKNFILYSYLRKLVVLWRLVLYSRSPKFKPNFLTTLYQVWLKKIYFLVKIVLSRIGASSEQYIIIIRKTLLSKYFKYRQFSCFLKEQRDRRVSSHQLIYTLKFCNSIYIIHTYLLTKFQITIVD